MTITKSDTTLGQLILVRLLGPKPRPSSKLSESLYELLDSHYSSAQWREAFEDALGTLKRDGYITEKQELTESGRNHALQFLGVSDVPSKITWPQLKSKYLVPRALGLSVDDSNIRKRISDTKAEGCRTAIIAADEQLRTQAVPTVNQAVDAFIWKLLGFNETKPISRTSIASAIIGRHLQIPITDTKQAVVQLAARLGSSRNTSVAELQKNIIGRLLNGNSPQVQEQPARQTSDSTTADERANGVDIQEFAELVNKLAKQCRTGKFGDHKVFISHVWREFQNESLNGRFTEEDFKQQLLEAFRQELVGLARADLIQAMDENDVRESEIRTDYSTFHFIRI